MHPKDTTLSRDAAAIFLTTAFDKFQETGKILEEKYSALKIETERLRRELQKKEFEVRRAERMAVLGQTAAALAHEIRNPLGAIKLFVSLLREDVAEMPQSVALVGEVEKSITQLDRVILNVLQFAKESECVLAPTNINSLLAEQADLIRKIQVDSKIKVVFHLCDQAYVLGSDHLLRQVLDNLFLNAAQAMKNGGTITVSSQLLFSQGKQQLCLKIEDSGPGIPAEILPRLFEPFATSRAEGTGLGLAVVKKILGQHQATIKATNSERGAQFEINFPLQISKERA